MKLDYALLATNADRMADDRLAIWGAEFEQLTMAGLPAIIQATLVVKVLVEQDEPLSGHRIRIEFEFPDGNRHSLLDTEIKAEKNKVFPDEPSGAILLANLAMAIKEAGKYIFHVFGDGVPMKRISLRIEAKSSNREQRHDHASTSA